MELTHEMAEALAAEMAIEIAEVAAVAAAEAREAAAGAPAAEGGYVASITRVFSFSRDRTKVDASAAAAGSPAPAFEIAVETADDEAAEAGSLLDGHLLTRVFSFSRTPRAGPPGGGRGAAAEPTAAHAAAAADAPAPAAAAAATAPKPNSPSALDALDQWNAEAAPPSAEPTAKRKRRGRVRYRLS